MSLWGQGLYARHYLRRRVSLRRNRFVYEVTLRVWRFDMTFLYRRKYQ